MRRPTSTTGSPWRAMAAIADVVGMKVAISRPSMRRSARRRSYAYSRSTKALASARRIAQSATMLRWRAAATTSRLSGYLRFATMASVGRPSEAGR